MRSKGEVSPLEKVNFCSENDLKAELDIEDNVKNASLKKPSARKTIEQIIPESKPKSENNQINKNDFIIAEESKH